MLHTHVVIHPHSFHVQVHDKRDLLAKIVCLWVVAPPCISSENTEEEDLDEKASTRFVGDFEEVHHTNWEGRGNTASLCTTHDNAKYTIQRHADCTYTTCLYLTIYVAVN